MRKSFRYLTVFLLTVIISGSLTVSVHAFSLGFSPVSVLRRVTDTIVNRVSDLVYYLIMQKEYIFNDFKDPNVYPKLEIPPEIEKISSSTGTVNPFSDQPIPVSSTSISGIKKTNPVSQLPLTRTVITPSPIIVTNPQEESVLGSLDNNIVNRNNNKILSYTNNERVAAGLSVLSADSVLDQIAEWRADDLFANQYFEHESPDGKSVSDLALKSNYEYLLIGENLAMGDFDSDQDIVSAWMDSPGHRANILNDKYTDLGVAIKQGVFNGENSTIAVQVFAKPLSTCPKPNPEMKALIDSATLSIKQMQTDASEMFVNLNVIKNSPGLDKNYYYQKIQEYNYFAEKVNAAVLALKAMVETYNIEVGRYNNCIAYQ